MGHFHNRSLFQLCHSHVGRLYQIVQREPRNITSMTLAEITIHTAHTSIVNTRHCIVYNNWKCMKNTIQYVVSQVNTISLFYFSPAAALAAAPAAALEWINYKKMTSNGMLPLIPCFLQAREIGTSSQQAANPLQSPWCRPPQVHMLFSISFWHYPPWCGAKYCHSIANAPPKNIYLIIMPASFSSLFHKDMTNDIASKNEGSYYYKPWPEPRKQLSTLPIIISPIVPPCCCILCKPR